MNVWREAPNGVYEPCWWLGLGPHPDGGTIVRRSYGARTYINDKRLPRNWCCLTKP